MSKQYTRQQLLEAIEYWNQKLLDCNESQLDEATFNIYANWKFRSVVKWLLKTGWTFKRQTGSHMIFGKPGHSAASVPYHGKIVPPGTMRNLENDAHIGIEQMYAALKRGEI